MASVDVVVPCYNYGRFLVACIDSILKQEGVDLRVLIIDNASTDDSLAIARRLAAKDPRVEVVAHATNKGATFSYNEGIDWGEAEYFLILDADDTLAPGALARAATVLDGDAWISFTHGIEARLETDGAVRSVAVRSTRPQVEVTTGLELIRRLCRTPVNNIGANTVIRRMSAQKQAGYYRASLPYTDDLEMWLRLATFGDVASIRTVQAIRRYHASRMSAHFEHLRDFTERERAFVSFFANEGRNIPGAQLLMADARRGLGQHAYWSAISHVCRGESHIGADLLRLSHRWRPQTSFLPPVQWLFRMDRPFERAAEIVSHMPPFRRKIAAGSGNSNSKDISPAR